MKVKIQKWGNSLALRIPKAFAFQSKIYEEEFVELKLEKNRLVIEPIKEKKYSLKKMIDDIESLNLHDEIEFGKSTGNEVW
ncbi:MAG: AbrB/MazE/SpoVT family DNA-binding domain-containing protein [Melioribacteraceae bacterium]|nr:AbrB/MazE/SpoVT family DNA-binding domain-containing protein [Melioribacteraceae bacterium]